MKLNLSYTVTIFRVNAEFGRHYQTEELAMLAIIERGGDGRPWRRGTSLAAELDRKLAGDEPLTDVVVWWHDSWRAS
jgi:hypothetical protein